MRLFGTKTEKSHFLYLIINQVFKSIFSTENETLRLFSQKKLFHVREKAFALTGRQACIHHYPGCCPGLRASALSGREELSGRVEPTSENTYPLDSIKEGADEPVADDTCEITYESYPGDVLHIPAEGNLLQAHYYHTSGTTDNQH